MTPRTRTMLLHDTFLIPAVPVSAIRRWLLLLSPPHSWCCRCFRALPLLEMHKDSAWGWKVCRSCYAKELAGINLKLAEKRRERVVEKHLREGKCLLCRRPLDSQYEHFSARLVCQKCEAAVVQKVMERRETA